jgi:hypothetical protein
VFRVTHVALRATATSALLVTLLSLGTLSAGATPSPYQAMISAIHNASTKHYVKAVALYTYTQGHGRATLEATPHAGSENLTLTVAGTTYQSDLVWSKDTLYLKANSPYLTTFLSYPSSTAATIANQWVIVPRHYPGYATLTLSSLLAEITMNHTARQLSPTVFRGMVGTPSTSLESETLHVTGAAHPLPTVAIQNVFGVKDTVTFSHWGQLVHVTSPSTTLTLPPPPSSTTSTTTTLPPTTTTSPLPTTTTTVLPTTTTSPLPTTTTTVLPTTTTSLVPAERTSRH